MKATRQAIVEFFKELPLEKRQHILQRFNDEFKGEEAKPLTVQKLRSFLKKELENERSILSRSPLAEALFYSVALQSVVTLWGTAAPAASTILGGWPAFFVTFGLAMVHDLTTTWRELHPEE
ncbi:MAG: hypothetical protein NT164_04890 [Verrucomicrobiae bacterium]|nr:hypothetical protein [Verrucomicrobiae bacterium]